MEREGVDSDENRKEERTPSGPADKLAVHAQLQKHANYVGDRVEGDWERGGMKDSGVPNGRLST